MKRFNIDGFSKYEFGLDGSVFNVKFEKFVSGVLCKGYIQFGLTNDSGVVKGLKQHQIVYKLFNQDYDLFQGNKMVVDHLNSDKLDNHISNLRLITHRENLSKERTSKSGLPVGVYYDKPTKKYRTLIFINNKHKHLGLFTTTKEASDVYQLKLKEIIN
jgi:hypothetical protein